MKFVEKHEPLFHSEQDEEQFGGSAPQKGNFIKDRAALRIRNILEVLSKLALIKGYDENGRIRGSNGQYVENSSIATLISHVMSSGKIVHGEKEFIKLLKDAKIKPELILNENIRQQLSRIAIPFISEERPAIVEGTVHGDNKRSREQSVDEEEDDDENIPLSKRMRGSGIKWIYPK